MIQRSYMRIIHSARGAKKEGEGQGSFLLSDKRGGYLCLPNKDVNESNYQGWLHFDPKEWTLYKTIENIYLSKPVKTFHNKFTHAERDSGASTERFFLYKNALIYELFNYDGFVNIDFDFRKIFDFSSEGRIFEFTPREGGVMVVKYQKYRDASLHELNYEKYLAIKNVQDYWVTGEWQQRSYEYDARRNSRHEFFIYGTLKIKVSRDTRMVFGQGDTEEEAVQTANMVWHDMHPVMNKLEKIADDELREKDIALNAAMNSLSSLTVRLKIPDRDSGVFAGFPWFFHFWARDELLSARALMLLGHSFLVKGILMDYLHMIKRDGWITNHNAEPDLKSADATGLLFMRFHDFLKILDEKIQDYFTEGELRQVKDILDNALQRVMESHTENGLVTNNALETWMDTYDEDDKREGARIEIQAYHLRVLSFAQFLARLLKEDASEYASMEEKFRKEVKKKFFRNKKLADGFVNNSPDMTQRPNVFLAYYAYPKLLNAKEWESAFDNALKELWLDWGGIASIGKSHRLYKEEHTGETNESYHRGDSWYYLNNIAAMCMLRLNPKKYAEKIRKIQEASSEEILFSGYLGHASEISSASKRESLGCRCQAWSAATFIEFAKETRP